jgi:hypothetical protein
MNNTIENLIIGTLTMISIMVIGGSVAMFFDCYTTALILVKVKTYE